jgi:hypothetical protein
MSRLQRWKNLGIAENVTDPKLSRLKTGRPNSAEEGFTSRQIAVSAQRKTGFGSRRNATGKIPKRGTL